MGGLLNTIGGMGGGLGGYGSTGKVGFMPSSSSSTQQQGVGMGGLFSSMGQQYGNPMGALFDYANSQGGVGGQQQYAGSGMPPGMMYANGTQGFSFNPWSNGTASMQQFVGQMPQQTQQQQGPSGGWGQGAFDPNKVPNNTWTMAQVAAYNQGRNGTLNSGVDYYHLPSVDEARASWESAARARQNPTPTPQASSWSNTLGIVGNGSTIGNGGLSSLPRAPIFQMGANPIAQRDAAYAASMGAQ